MIIGPLLAATLATASPNPLVGLQSHSAKWVTVLDQSLLDAQRIFKIPDF